MHRSSLLLPLALLLAACGHPPAPAAPAVPAVPARMSRVEVLWDTWGVPHIYAQDATAAVYAYGWTQMRNHGDLLLRLYGQARGRAAEYWGERYDDSDVWVRTNGIPARAERWLAEQEPYERALLNAFAAGINAYAQLHPDSLAPDVRAVLPVQPQDVLAHVQRVLHYTFLVSPQEVAGIRRSWENAPGSNAWAIAPARSASRSAMLLANPHLPWGDLFTWFEAQLSSPELSAYGATLVGFPLPGIAFNDSLGWSFTVNTLDAADLYQLELRGDGYVMDGNLQPFERETQTLRVRQADGTTAERKLEIRRSVHGPVVAEKAGSALALRVAGLDSPHLVAQWFDMARAHNLRQFEGALSRLQLPLFTVMYADAAGHIMSYFNGALPVRMQGDARYWSGIVPGNTSLTLWSSTYGYSQLPRVVDPKTGWLQNANEPPWTTTLPMPLDPSRYPASLPQPGMTFRSQRSARMLAQDSSITFDELIAYKHSTRMELADHILEDLVHAARTYGGADARAAADVLEKWDRSANAGSRGAVLFQAFATLMRRQQWPRGIPYDVGWSARVPLATPDGLSDARIAAQLLDRAAAQVRTRYGSLDVAWGEVVRLRRDSLDLPASGGPGDLGIFRVLNADSVSADRSAVSAGDTYVAAVEFASPVRARAVLGYGNASQPASPHRTDQLPLVAEQRLRDVWLTRADVEAHLKAREWF